MAKYSGIAGRVYMSTTGTGNATSLTGAATWSLSMSTDKFDAVDFDSTNKEYTQGLKDITGSLSVVWDDTSDTLYDGMSSADGVKLYLYPSNNVLTKYFYGPAIVDFNIEVGQDTIKCTSAFSAKGAWGQV